MPRAPQLSGATAPAGNRIDVAAGVLRDEAGRVLLAERQGDDTFHGLWEFPGGKIDAGETPACALCRELREELGIDATGYEHLLTLDHDYADRRVRLHFFLVTSWREPLRSVTGQGLRWTAIDELDRRDLLPADASVVDILRRLAGACPPGR